MNIQDVKSRGPYDKPKRVSISYLEAETKTKQSFRDECDINSIMARHQRTGAITHLQNHQGQYGFASGIDFHESMNIVTKAQSMFNELPSSIRTKFENSPAKFLDFVQEPKNADELVSLGLAYPGIAEPGVPGEKPVDDDSGDDPAKEPSKDP